jgi:hypothetical protein
MNQLLSAMNGRRSAVAFLDTKTAAINYNRSQRRLALIACCADHRDFPFPCRTTNPWFASHE